MDGKSEAVKISKLGGGKSHSRYPNPKSQYPPGVAYMKMLCHNFNVRSLPGLGVHHSCWRLGGRQIPQNTIKNRQT